MKHAHLVGQKFNRWTVVSQGKSEKTRSGTRKFWLCRCDCGNTAEVGTHTLRTGASKSCGCYAKESLEKRKQSGVKKKFRAEYNIWNHMKRRCYTPTTKCYSRYGGRGITVCSRWLESFENFYADMGPKPKGMSIDRVDNDGPYSPENCRWATHPEQMRNTRQTRYFEWAGMRMCLQDWCDKVGMNAVTVHRRMQQGWAFETALSTPPGELR